MSASKGIKLHLARLTGIQAALDSRVAAVDAKHQEALDALTREHEDALAAMTERAERGEYLYRTNHRVVTAYRDLAVIYDQLPRFEYGSLSEGRADWSAKWASSRGLRILMFANHDYSGSFYKWTAAINDHTDHAARLVVAAPHRYGYPVDLVLPNPELVESNWDDLWGEADVLHLKDETGFFRGPNRLPDEMLRRFEGPAFLPNTEGMQEACKTIRATGTSLANSIRWCR